MIITSKVIIAQTNPTIEIERPINLSYEQAMEVIFGSLDLSKIQSGVLKERSIQLLNWDNFNGQSTVSFLTKDSLLQLYSELYYAHFNKSGLT